MAHRPARLTVRLVRSGRDRHPRIPPRLAGFAIGGNALSGVAILTLVVTGLLPLTGLGVAFMLVGAVWVATFAALAYIGLRRSRSLS
jgi:hypothetical protein